METKSAQSVTVNNGKRCYRITVEGVVQGVGYRPFVYRHAKQLGVNGYVENNTGQVTIEVESDQETVEKFCALIKEQKPETAHLLNISIDPVEIKNYTKAKKVISRGSFADWGSAGKSRSNPYVTIDGLEVLKHAGLTDLH